MNETIGTIFVAFIYVLIAAILIRVLLSYFPVRRDNQLVRMLDLVTEPLLEPARRVVPRIGMFDFSATVVIILLYVMAYVVGQTIQS